MKKDQKAGEELVLFRPEAAALLGVKEKNDQTRVPPSA
jgi:hypothetical protein